MVNSMRIRSEGKQFLQSALVKEIIFIVLLIVLGAIVFHIVEKFTRFMSLYFTVTTMTTIGFGDVAPKTELWRVFVMIYALLGVPLFISLSWLILESRFNHRIKTYINKLHAELHVAEENIKTMENEVSDELAVAIKEASRDVKRTEKEVEHTQEKVEKTEREAKDAEKEVEDTEKEVVAAEKEVKDIKNEVSWTSSKPWRKRKFF